jgi:hypothetical protein
VLFPSNKTAGKGLPQRENCLPPLVALWQNRGNFFFPGEVESDGVQAAPAGKGELTRLTGLSKPKKEIA